MLADYFTPLLQKLTINKACMCWHKDCFRVSK